MRAGAVSINLAQANRIFLMEPYFNPALEVQAIGRVHRLGQRRSVEIICLLMKDSIDSPMVEMLEKIHGKLDGSETNGKTDEDDDADDEKGGNKDTNYMSKSDADSDFDETETATMIPVTETRNQRQSKIKGWRWISRARRLSKRSWSVVCGYPRGLGR
jgi:SNF2 family DNA or RNA helicase